VSDVVAVDGVTLMWDDRFKAVVQEDILDGRNTHVKVRSTLSSPGGQGKSASYNADSWLSDDDSTSFLLYYCTR